MEEKKVNSFEWNEDTVIDFVNWYIRLHKLPLNYELENRTIIESFIKGDDYKKWYGDNKTHI